MVLEELALGILSFVNWGITILVFMLLIELWRFFNFHGAGSAIGSKLGEPFSKLAERGGIKGDFKMTADRVKRLWRGEQKEEKFELKKYVSLEKLKTDVQAANSDADLKRTVGSSERTAKRDESRAYRRLESLENDLRKAGLNPEIQAKVNKMVEEIEVFNNIVLEKMRRFDANLKIPASAHDNGIKDKKDTLLKAVNEAIAAERALVVEMQKLNSLFK